MQTLRNRPSKPHILHRKTVVEFFFATLFTLVPLFIGIVLVVVTGGLVVSMFRNLSEW